MRGRVNCRQPASISAMSRYSNSGVYQPCNLALMLQNCLLRSGNTVDYANLPLSHRTGVNCRNQVPSGGMQYRSPSQIPGVSPGHTS